MCSSGGMAQAEDGAGEAAGDREGRDDARCEDTVKLTQTFHNTRGALVFFFFCSAPGLLLRRVDNDVHPSVEKRQ